MMARMSIDDKFLRDGRVKLLGQRFGWSRRETMGALLDVFAVAYDQEDDVIPVAEIDAAADEAGFAMAMVAVNLGEMDGDDVRIKGAAERIEYLAKKREAGAKGGRKSGESRRNRREAKRSTASEAREASWNPPDPVPDLAPDPVPDLGRDAPASPPLPTEPPGPDPLTLQPSQPKTPRPAKATKHRLPAGWTPRPQERERAAREGINADLEAERFRDHHTAKGNAFCDWDAAFRTWLGNAQRFANGTRNGPGSSAERAPDPPRKIPTLVR